MKNRASIRQFIWTRKLPKTGQIISYQSGDDGYHEYGWWQGRYNSDNKTRFIEKIINGDIVVIDLATGLMWAADGNAAGCFNGGLKNFADAITYCQSLNFAGFADWHNPNVKQLLSLIEYDADLYVASKPLIKEWPFSNTQLATYSTSTTLPDTTTSYMIVSFHTGHISATSKVNARRLRACRIL